MRFIFASLIVSVALGQQFNEFRFNQLISKLEGDAVDLAREVERLYADRCSISSLSDCGYANYNDCTSIFPDQVCTGGEQLNIPSCGDGETCSALWDFTVSAVSLPSDLANGIDGNPTDPPVIESICFTRELDNWLVRKREDDWAFWDGLGIESPSMHFGSHHGSFRIFPARSHSGICGSYDPRVRPWYVAASSGPKNVIMVLDTSGSMAGHRLLILKAAAKRVIDTLAVGDRVAIVVFNSSAKLVGSSGGFLYRATEENKAILTRAIDNLDAGGNTNFYNAFTTAFDALDNSAMQEFTVGCNSAILFLTDGQMTPSPQINEQTVTEMVVERLNHTSSLIGHPIILFTYSVSENENVHEFPSTLACSSEFGVWSKISRDDELFESLSSYYLLFALGLGSDTNEDFVAWVEPYRFSTGGLLGTTVSIPVFDRSKIPHLFLGVAGVDFLMAALDAALGVTSNTDAKDGASQESINRVALASQARCPVLELKLCELESFRRQGGAGNAALCTNKCTDADFVQVEEERCPAVHDYPRQLFSNTQNLGVAYEERVCCRVGETKPSVSCIADVKSPSSSAGSNTVAIAAGVVGGVIGLITAGVIVWKCRGEAGNNPTKKAMVSSKKSAHNLAVDVPIPTPILPPPMENPEAVKCSAPFHSNDY